MLLTGMLALAYDCLMNITLRVDELVNQGVPVGEAIARAIQEKAASVAATEAIAHGGVA